MSVCYRQRLAAETVGSGRDVMAAQHILLHLLRYPSLNVIIEGCVELGVCTQDLGHGAGQETATVAGSILGIVIVVRQRIGIAYRIADAVQPVRGGVYRILHLGELVASHTARTVAFRQAVQRRAFVHDR